MGWVFTFQNATSQHEFKIKYFEMAHWTWCWSSHPIIPINIYDWSRPSSVGGPLAIPLSSGRVTLSLHKVHAEHKYS